MPLAYTEFRRVLEVNTAIINNKKKSDLLRTSPTFSKK